MTDQQNDHPAPVDPPRIGNRSDALELLGQVIGIIESSAKATGALAEGLAAVAVGLEALRDAIERGIV